jgi:general secretion pathway protein G
MLHLRLHRPLRRRSAGFTLIELVVVLAIVAILALAAQPLHELTLRRSQEAALRHALRELRQAIDEHRAAVARRAIAPGADATVYPPTLQALVAGVPLIDEQGRPRDDARLYLLRRLPRDPFADPALPAAETWGLRASSSPPDAPEAGADVFDVYSRSPLVALDGTRYRDW